MNDSFKKFARSLTSPPEHALEIISSDVMDLSEASRALYVGGAGDISVRMLGGEILVLRNVPAGTFLPLRVAQVMATGTTATDIVSLW